MMRRRLALPSIAIVACLCCCPGVLSADELWQVSEGSTAFSFDRAQIERLGLEVSSAGAPVDSENRAKASFTVDPDSTLAFSIEGGSLAGFLGGQIRHIGGLSIKGAHGSVHLDALTLSQVRGEAGGDHWVVQDAAGQAAGLILNRAKAGPVSPTCCVPSMTTGPTSRTRCARTWRPSGSRSRTNSGSR